MFKKTLTFLALLCMSASIYSQIVFDGVWPEGYSCSIEPFQVHSETEGDASLDGYTTYRMYINCVNPEDRVTIVYGIEGLETQINFSGDLYQHEGTNGGITPNIPCAFFNDVAIIDPLAQYDSYVCLGTNCSASASPINGDPWIPAQSIGAIWAQNFEAGENILINDALGGSWFSIGDADAAKNTWAGVDQKVQIGQFTTNGEITAVLTFTIFPEGESGENTYEVHEAPCSNGLVGGCTDIDACNFDSNAEFNDASCQYVCAISLVDVVTSNALCPNSANGSVSIDTEGSQGGTQYTITDGPSNDSGIFVNSLLPGIYTYQVSDNSFLECGGDEQCMVEGTFEIGPLDFELETDVTEIACYGQDSGEICITDVNGGTGPYLYDCNNDGIFGDDACISGLENNTYAIAIEDSNGCLFELSFDLINPEPLSVVASSENSLCGNDSNGSIEFCETTGGTGEYTYSIDGGATFIDDCQFENLSGGVYDIVVMDEGGCSGPLMEIEISEPDAISTTLVDLIGAVWDPITESYVFDDLGYLEFLADGGTGSLTFFWNVVPEGYVPTPNASSNYLEDLIAGEYCVQISDALGCVHSECFTVDQIIDVNEIVNDVVLSIYPNPSQGDYILYMDGLNGEKLSYTIIDGLGRVVSSEELGNRSGLLTTDIDLSNESDGFYYLQIRNQRAPGNNQIDQTRLKT